MNLSKAFAHRVLGSTDGQTSPCLCCEKHLAQPLLKQTSHVSSANHTTSNVMFAKQGCRVNCMAGSMDTSAVIFTHNDMMAHHFTLLFSSRTNSNDTSFFYSHEMDSYKILHMPWLLCCCGMNIMFNSLWPSGTICWQKSGLTLVQVMACCLTGPSHYLNQCWGKVQWHSSECNFTRNTSAISRWN